MTIQNQQTEKMKAFAGLAWPDPREGQKATKGLTNPRSVATQLARPGARPVRFKQRSKALLKLR